MINHLRTPYTRQLLALVLSTMLMLSQTLMAAPVELATSPLATSSNSAVFPNLMFMLDDSGSMDWDYMPDDAKDFDGKYGFYSSQCNGVYYNPDITYSPPVDSAGISYPNSSFTNAWDNGYDTGAGTTDLSTDFRGGSGSGSSGSSLSTYAAFYYLYTGTLTNSIDKDFFDNSSPFYQECDSGSAPGIGNSKFTRVLVSAVSGPGGTDERTNFANWYSYYSNRMLTMKTGVGLAFKTVGGDLRLGYMSMNNNNSNDFVDIAPFNPTQKSTWYSKLYAANPGNRTPLREALAKVGHLYANKYGPTTIYSATIKVGGSGNTSVTSVMVDGVELLDGAANDSSRTRNVASNIASEINSLFPSLYSATASSDNVTIFGPASALGFTPVVTDDGGGMVFSTSAFTSTTITGQLNGVTPNDPIEYSCQKNFVILSTDGYWNGSAGYKLDDSSIGNQDGAAARAMYDGAVVDEIKTQIFQSKSEAQQETSTLEGTLSKVLMQCNNDATTCGTAPSNGEANADWSVVIGSNGNCAAASNVQCAIVSGLSSTSPVVNTCDTSASINATSGAGSATITITNSNNVRVRRVRADGTRNTDILASSTSSSSNDDTVASRIASEINRCTNRRTGSCDVSGHSATVSGNVVTVSGPDVTSGLSVSLRSGSATIVVAYSAAAAGYILSNADVNGFIYSACAYTAWSTPAAVASCTDVNRASNPNNTSIVTATKCTTSTVQTSTAVASCTDSNSGAPNYTQTTCNTVSTTNSSVSTCTPENASAANNYTTTTCSSSSGGTSDTLADTAMYYYETDLRDSSLSNCTGALGTDVCTNNVPVSGIDTNDNQHLTTFTLGLGARGRMAFSSTYLDDTSGDFYSVLTGATADSSQIPPICSWQSDGSTCNWPTPSSGAVENIDDLWHAAIDGRGTYFSANDPASLATGLSEALKSIDQVTGAAAAAATSTLNPTATDNFAYVASYTTEKWTGNLEQRTINIDTGVVSTTADWCIEDVAPSTCSSPDYVYTDTSGASTAKYCARTAVDQNGDLVLDNSDCPSPMTYDSGTTTCRVPITNVCNGTLSSRVAATSDTRNIYTASSGVLVPFDAAYATANSGYFDAARISGLTQWTTLTAAQQAAAAGTNLLLYLRGQNGYESNRTSNVAANWIFRFRDAVLGDALESQPTFIAHPTFSYSDPGYNDFVTSNASRASTIYIGANDGMLHAFAGADGTERWAYIPSMIIPNMWQLADTSYSSKHVNFVNGPPVISDICTANCTNTGYALTVTTADDPVWKTILVGGLNAGGRGYYALDITDPVTPKLLWEFTSADSANLGYTFGKPVVTKLNAANGGTWVVLVTSGYDNGTLSADGVTANSPTGDGKGHLFVLNAQTGAIISDIATTAGSPTTPSGLAKFNAYNDIDGNNQAGLTYAGDLLGNVWRFDINTPASAPVLFATLKDGSGVAQPVTVAPTLGKIYGEPVIFVGTGKYLEVSDLTDTQTQSLYAIKDDDSGTFTNPRTTLVQQSINPGTPASIRTGTSNTVDFRTGRGWFIDFPDTGERVNIDSKLVQGTILVPTIVPSTSTCSPGGYGWLNFFDYKTGGYIDTSALVSQRYDSPIVGMNVIYIKGQPIVEVVTSSNPTPEKPVTDIPFQASSGSFLKSREVWRELIP